MRIETGTTARRIILPAGPRRHTLLVLLLLAVGCSHAAQDQSTTRHDSTPIDTVPPDTAPAESVPGDTLRHPIGDPGRVPRPGVTVPRPPESVRRAS
jgi:hypothetical protein